MTHLTRIYSESWKNAVFLHQTCEQPNNGQTREKLPARPEPAENTQMNAGNYSRIDIPHGAQAELTGAGIRLQYNLQ